MIKRVLVTAGIAAIIGSIGLSVHTRNAGASGVDPAPDRSDFSIWQIFAAQQNRFPLLRNPASDNDGREHLRSIDDPNGRANWFMQQRMYPFASVPTGARQAAFQEVLDNPELNRPSTVG